MSSFKNSPNLEPAVPISAEQKEAYRDVLRDLPISINNLADPAILRDSTEQKIRMLMEDKHTGPVALITKGDLSTRWWKERLPEWADNLNLFVFSSVSNLPRSMEPASQESRYKTIRAAKDAGAKSISYIRPMIHTVNDSDESVRYMFQRSKDSGADAIVSSGFRGDKEVVKSTGLEDIEAPDGQHWSKILKITSQRVADLMRQLSHDLDIKYWTRTACAVSALSGKDHSLNPYHLAPKFAGCGECSQKESCADRAEFLQPVNHSVSLLNYLGFQTELHTAGERYKRCDVEKRQQCTLCCTNCPVAPANYGVPYLNIRSWDGSTPSWGEMSLARFATGGMLATDPHIKPGETSNVRLHPRFKMPDGKNGQGGLYGVNSWMVWSEYLPKDKCLKCSYCFLSMFEDVLPPEMQVTVGMSPSRILDCEEINYSTFAPRKVSLPLIK
jgi:DNA repair photolyase